MTDALHAAGLWAGLLILLMVVLSTMVVSRRRRRLVSFGDGGHDDLAAASRAFGNASEYAPVGIAALILLALLGAPEIAVHAIGATLFVGRVTHALGLLFQRGPSLGRVLGMVLTYLALIVSAGGLIVLAFL